MEKEKTKKKVKKQTIKKDSYMHGVKTEMKKVKWPTVKEVSKYALATVLFCIVLGLFFYGVDFLSSVIKGLFN